VSWDLFSNAVSAILPAIAGGSRESPWERAPEGTNQDHRKHESMPGLPQDMRGRKRVSCRVGERAWERARGWGP
jgi:hypothetical protein